MMKNYDDMLSRFHTIQYQRVTDRQTDRIAISISRVSVLTRDKNHRKPVVYCTNQTKRLMGKTIKTRRMAIAKGTGVSFCNQPKAQFGYLREVTSVCRCLHPFCGWRHLATARESKAHFGLPWVRISLLIYYSWSYLYSWRINK